MVGSTLNSATTAALCSLAPRADLDGSLLVAAASDPFCGGFEWGAGGTIVLTDAPGVGVGLK